MHRISLFIFIFIAHAFVVPAAHGAAAVGIVNRCADLFESKTTGYRIVTAPDGRVAKSGATEVEGRFVYYESLPAAPGKPTAMVFLGLFTPMIDLATFQEEFARQSDGEGLLIFTYSTQFESLYAGSIANPKTYADNIKVSIDDFVKQATGVVNAVGVHIPVTVVGYSYGSAPAARFAEFHKGRVTNLIFAAPLIYPGEHAPELLAAQKAIETMALMTPIIGTAVVENMRKMTAENMAERIFKIEETKGKIPAEVPRDVLRAAFVAQIRAVENFDLRREPVANWPKTHFLLAGKENTARLSAQREAVRVVQAHEASAGRVITAKDGDHVIMADAPAEVARVVLEVLRSEQR